MARKVSGLSRNETMDSTMRRINHYPLDNSIGLDSVYPLDSDVSAG